MNPILGPVATAVARAMEATYPHAEEPSDPVDSRVACLEARRRQWAAILGALPPALMAVGHLHAGMEVEFYREAGLEIFD